MNISNIKHLVLSGGGLLGISYIGLFKYLEEHNVNCQIQTITGCSAGAIFGAFLAVGYTGEELDKITKGLCFKDYLNITAESIINFMRLKGLESGKKLMSLIKKIIKDKTNDENITFSQIQARFNITLKIGVTNLTTSKFELLSYINMPNLPIYQAINASIAIPFIFEPVVINNNIYVDGGLLDNLPIEQILNFEANANANVNGLKENAIDNSPVNTELIDIEINTLCIYLMNKFTELTCDNYHLLPLSHYFNAIIHSISNGYIIKKTYYEKMANYKIIVYEIPCDIMTFIKLNASHEDIDNIIKIAYDTTKNQLDKIDKVDKVDKIDKVDKVDKIDKVDKVDKLI